MKKAMTIVLIVLGIIAVGVGGYFAYGYLNKEEACKIDTSQVQKGAKIDLVTQNILKDIIKIKVNYLFEEDYTNFNTLDNEAKFSIGNIKNEDYISADKIDENLTNVFGDTVTIGKSNIMCFVNDYIMYDYSGGYFQKHDQFEHPGHGGNIINADYTNFVKFEKVGNKYIVYTNEVYFNIGEFVYNTGSDYRLIQDSDYDANDTAEEVFDENYEDIKDNLNLRKYTFEIENNRYILKSFKIVK